MLWQVKFPSNLCRHLISQVLRTFFIWNKWIIQPPVSVCAGKQPECCQWPLSLSVFFCFILFCTFASSLFVIFFLPLISNTSEYLHTASHLCVCLEVLLVFLFSINISHWTFMSCHLCCQSPLLVLNQRFLTKKTDSLDLFETIRFMYIYLLMYFLPVTATDEGKAADGQSPFCIGCGDTGCGRHSSRTASGWNRG